VTQSTANGHSTPTSLSCAFAGYLVSHGRDEEAIAFALLVRFLDVGGIPVAEAPGLAAIVSGARSLKPDDDALLLSVTPALDSLYHTHSTEQN